jgi:hypothetical protein
MVFKKLGHIMYEDQAHPDADTSLILSGWVAVCAISIFYDGQLNAFQSTALDGWKLLEPQ